MKKIKYLILLLFTCSLLFNTYADTNNNIVKNLSTEKMQSPKWLLNTDTSKDKNINQIIVVSADDLTKSTATLTMHNRNENGTWEQILSTYAYVGKNGLCFDEEHYEGCGQTPIGIYKFNKAFGIADDPGCILDYTKVDNNIYWSGDQNTGMHYNEMVNIIDFPNLDKNNSEHIIDYTDAYQYCLNISFNEDAIPDKGSAIFLHCLNGDKTETAGCVAIPKDMMKYVMQNVKKDCVIIIDTYSNLNIDGKVNTQNSHIKFSDDSSGFVNINEVIPDIILEMRYSTTYNFVGNKINGYEEPIALLTKEAATALKNVSNDLIKKGYRLKIYDSYRPQMAVNHFVKWSKNEDTSMKQYFYPELEKNVLFPQGYIAKQSGHSRGSTLDLTLFDMKTEKEVDMGGTFDYFGQLSHPDYKNITDEQYNNRMILRQAMTKFGFKPLDTEWWHFTLNNEPYPDTYFTFPINSKYIK